MTGPLPDDVVQAFLNRYRQERRDAGLPEYVEDQAVLDQVAALVVGSQTREAHTDSSRRVPTGKARRERST
jgi:hypothetical protein